LEKQGAQWDFANGTVTLGDKCIQVHRRHRTGICRRIMVASDCMIPAKHEANIPVYLEDDGVPIPPCNWAIEPQGLGPGVMAARTLFSDKQELLVARVLNNSQRDKPLSVNSFLSVAEPMQCLSGTDSSHTSGIVLAEPVYPCGFGLLDESTLSAKSSCLSAMVTTDAVDASAPSAAATTAEVPATGSSSPSSEAQSNHIDGLLCNVPAELTSEQKD